MPDKTMIKNLDLPSLEHCALMRILTVLWDLDSVILSVRNYATTQKCYRETTGPKCFKSNFTKIIVEWQSLKDIEIFLEKRIFELRLPPRLSQKMCNLIQTITIEIIKWLFCQKRISSNEIFLKLSVKNILWTAHGTVDDKRTAEALINSKDLDVAIKYKLACTYCLEKYAKMLWEKLPIQRQNDYLNKVPHARNMIVQVMTYYIRNEINKLQLPRTDMGVFEHALRISAEHGNKAATNFFLGKLKSELNIIPIILSQMMNLHLISIGELCFPTGHHSEVVQILMANVTETSELLNPAACLAFCKLLLEWPVQPLFIDVVQCFRTSLNTHVFYCIMFSIIQKIEVGYTDYSYSTLLKDFLKLFPEYQSLYPLEPFHFFYHFFRKNDEEGVSLLLKGSSWETKQKLIFHFRGRELCEVLAFQKNWNLLQFFIQQCVPEENLRIFQNIFQKVPIFPNGFSSYEFYGVRTENYEVLYRYVGDLIQRKDAEACRHDSMPLAKRTRSQGFAPITEILNVKDIEWP